MEKQMSLLRLRTRSRHVCHAGCQNASDCKVRVYSNLSVTSWGRAGAVAARVTWKIIARRVLEVKDEEDARSNDLGQRVYTKSRKLPEHTGGRSAQGIPHEVQFLGRLWCQEGDFWRSTCSERKQISAGLGLGL